MLSESEPFTPPFLQPMTVQVTALGRSHIAHHWCGSIRAPQPLTQLFPMTCSNFEAPSLSRSTQGRLKSVYSSPSFCLFIQITNIVLMQKHLVWTWGHPPLLLEFQMGHIAQDSLILLTYFLPAVLYQVYTICPMPLPVGVSHGTVLLYCVVFFTNRWQDALPAN